MFDLYVHRADFGSLFYACMYTIFVLVYSIVYYNNIITL